MKTDALDRRSRWHLSGGGKDELDDIDFQILQQLVPYRALSTPYLAGLTGLSLATIQSHVADLVRGPHHWLLISKECTERPSNNQQFTYELGPKGREALFTLYLEMDELPSLERRRNFDHQMMVDTTFASIQIAAEPRLVHPSEIIARPNFPQDQRDKDHPFSMEVPDNRRKKGNKPTYDYIPDGFRSLEKNGKWLHMQIEAEHTSQSFRDKFRAVQHIMRSKLYDVNWTVDNLITLVVTPKPRKIRFPQLHLPHKKETMIGIIMDETKKKGASYILFREVPMFGAKLEPIKDIYTGTWQRAGHPDISLKELFDGRK